MQPAPQPDDDAERCSALASLSVLDTPAEERFDRLTRLAQRLFGVSIALVSLVDRDRQWFKSRQGLDATETERRISFCGHAILRREVFVVEDALADERFADNPLVVEEPHIRFYAGCPLRGPGGHLVGTLCVIDDKPRRFDTRDRDALIDLAQLVENELRKPPPKPSASVSRRFFSPQGWLSRMAEQASQRHRAGGVALLVAVLLAISAAYWDHKQGEAFTESTRRAARHSLGLMRTEIATALYAKLHLVHSLSGLVHASDHIDDRDFTNFASELGRNMPHVRSLQLAPQGVVSYVWPMSTESPALGYDLLADASRQAASRRAIETGELWLDGPLELIQGGTALIARLPVFRTAEAGEASVWWGFATVLIDMPGLLDEVGLTNADDRFVYALRNRDAFGNGSKVFFGPGQLFTTQAPRTHIELPNGGWDIAIEPRGGWPHSWQGQQGFRVGAAVVIVLMAALVYFLLRLPHSMRRAIGQATQELEMTQARFRDAIEALPAGFAVFDADDRLAVCNERLRSIYTRTRPQLQLGRSFEDLVQYSLRAGEYLQPSANEDDQHAKFLAAAVDRHHQSGQAQDLALADGRWIRVIEEKTMEGGRVSFHIDVTDEKLAERSLQESRARAVEANAAKSTFLATVSHEVRTPLNGVLGLLGVLSDDEGLSVQQAEYVRTAHQSGLQLLALLNEILDISKMEANRLELETGAFRMADTVRGVVELVRAQADEKGIALQADIDPIMESQVEGDEGRIRQVLLNLVSNAVKFTDAGSVCIVARPCGETAKELTLELLVQDTGIGFDDVQAEQLFEPFSQLDSDVTRRYLGTGLGLAICRRLVKLMGGEISADGRPGKGAVFRVELTLPRLGDSSELALNVDVESTEPPTPASLGLPPVRVLLAEDSPTNQLVIKAMLKGTGYTVDVVGTGKEAVDAIERLPYDLVLMDVYMPEMDGLQATREVRAAHGQQKLPIVALTANAMAGDRERFVAAGMDDYLPKPIHRRALLATMYRWVEERKGALAAQDTVTIP